MKIKENVYDVLTTVFGAIISAVVMLNVDYGKVLAGDTAEQGKIVGAVVVAVFGWLTNKTNKESQK